MRGESTNKWHHEYFSVITDNYKAQAGYLAYLAYMSFQLCDEKEPNYV